MLIFVPAGFCKGVCSFFKVSLPVFTEQHLKAVWVLFSPMVSRSVVKNILSGLYLRNLRCRILILGKDKWLGVQVCIIME